MSVRRHTALALLLTFGGIAAGLPIVALGEVAGAAPGPQLAIGDTTVPEGNSGRRPARIVLRLSEPVPSDTIVRFTITGDSATPAEDFIARTGKVKIRAGRLSANVSVPVLGDQSSEPDETVTVSITDGGGVFVADASGSITIRDDEGLSGVSIGSTVVWEGDTGKAPAPLNVVLDSPRATDTFIDFTTSDDDASAGSDYRFRQGRVRIAAGRIHASITPQTYGDADGEPEEHFTVTLTGTGTSGVPIAHAVADVVIRDDDVPATPDAPTLEVVPGPFSRYLTADWTAPSSPTAIVGYDLEVTRIGITNIVADVTAPYAFGCGLAVVTDVCIVRVRARNGAGEGPWSDPQTVATWAPPAAPVDLQLLPGGNAIAWTEPPSDRPINHYEVQQNTGGTWSHVTTTQNLAVATSCSFCSMRVRASSEVGVGAWASVAIARPGSPVELTAARDAGNPELVHLSWSPPLDPGSHPVESYEVFINEFPISTVGETTTDLFLRATLSWEIDVYAVNTAGRSLVPATVVVPPA
jgi:hypothetical protein